VLRRDVLDGAEFTGSLGGTRSTARVLAPPAGELDGGSVASGRQNWHAGHGRLGPVGTSNDFIATDKDVHNNPPLEAALVAKSDAPTSTTRLVVKGVGVKVDGRRSNKKETLSWSLSILFLDDGDDECK
jgi:hypothetical protein